MTEPLLLTAAEAAAHLRISARTLRRARASGALRAVAIGRVRYRLADLEDYIAGRSRGGHDTGVRQRPRRLDQVYEIGPIPGPQRRRTAG